jgi:hypothetical protein
MIRLESYQMAPYNGPAGPGIYSIDGSNYEDCALCLRAYSGCEQSGCDKTYYADEGTVEITQLGGVGTTFTATLKGVVFKEATIDPNTYRSTNVPNGDRWCMDGVQLSSDTGEPSSGAVDGDLPIATTPADASCVSGGTGTGPALIGQNVGDFQLQNCNGEMVSFHASCGNKVKWLMSTAEWCTACTAQLQSIASQYGGYISKENLPEGLDMWIVLTENMSYGKPSLDLCKQYAAAKNIDPSMLFLDWSDTEVQVPLVLPEGYAISTNAYGTVWNKINPYLTADSSGSVSSFTPWHAVMRGSNMEHIWSSFYDETKYASSFVEQLLSE